MSATGLEVFDTTVQKTNTWLKDFDGGNGGRSAQGLSGVASGLTRAARPAHGRGSASPAERSRM
jgi:hypothetical protein